MDKIKRIGLAALAMAAVSCESNSPYSREMQQVDSLYNVVEGYNQKLNELDHEEIMNTYDEVKETYAYLSENYPDSSDRQFWLTDMNYLARVQKAHLRYTQNIGEIKEQVEYTQRQLGTLRNTLEDGKMPNDQELQEDKVEQYVHTEGLAVEALKFRMNKIYNELQSAQVVWDSLQPRFDSIGAHLRQQP